MNRFIPAVVLMALLMTAFGLYAPAVTYANHYCTGSAGTPSLSSGRVEGVGVVQCSQQTTITLRVRVERYMGLGVWDVIGYNEGTVTNSSFYAVKATATCHAGTNWYRITIGWRSHGDVFTSENGSDVQMTC